jgi:hypothetical protein
MSDTERSLGRGSVLDGMQNVTLLPRLSTQALCNGALSR